MGKAFARELDTLESTFEWALSCDVRVLKNFVAEVAGLPLVAIGSGGSTTACHLTALLHRSLYHRPAFFTTPLDVLSIPAGLHRSGVFIASASGNNKDVLSALQASVAEETPAIAVVTMRAESLLSNAARLYSRAHVFAADAPTGKDGYLATNTLFATCILIARAYGFGVSFSKAQRKEVDGAIFEGRHMLQILHSGWGSPVATDLESKLNESALAAAQLTDYRNFGHGRHLWLAKRSAETVVIALVTPGNKALAEATLKLIPKNIRVIRLDTFLDGPDGTLDLLVQGFHLVDHIGIMRNQDPGRPHVPEFGRKLYRLAPPRVRSQLEAPVQRKIWASPEALDDGMAFRQGLKRFLARTDTAKIGAIAFDYDGTLCGKDGRFDGLRDDVVAECSRLLKAGLHLGIATGRGRSVRYELQKALNRKFWDRVHIGYYNGTVIGSLADDSMPNRGEPSDRMLMRAEELLSADDRLTSIANVDLRPQQITVEPKGTTMIDAVAAHVMARLAPLAGDGVRIVVSSHSLDVLGPGPGKASLVSWVREQIGENREVLCIGDRGAWPGNDYALLAQPMSLSVDEVSSLDDACWNLAPRGVSGPDATLIYLRAIKTRKGIGTFKWKEGAAR